MCIFFTFFWSFAKWELGLYSSRKSAFGSGRRGGGTPRLPAGTGKESNREADFREESARSGRGWFAPARRAAPLRGEDRRFASGAGRVRFPISFFPK